MRNRKTPALVTVTNSKVIPRERLPDIKLVRRLGSEGMEAAQTLLSLSRKEVAFRKDPM